MATIQGSLKFEQDGLFRDAQGHWDYEAQGAAEEAWVLRLKTELRAKAKGDLVGEEVCFPQGDGYARYLIVKERPFTLVHLDVGDAWHAHPATIRGYRLQDARAQVEQDRVFAAQLAENERRYQKLLQEHKVLHYHDGFGQFIRCEVVQDPSSKVGATLKPVALVGEWPEYALKPGSYQGQLILEWRTFLPHISNIFEASERLQRERLVAGKPDPRGMEPLVLQQQISLFA